MRRSKRGEMSRGRWFSATTALSAQLTRRVPVRQAQGRLRPAAPRRQRTLPAPLRLALFALFGLVALPALRLSAKPPRRSDGWRPPAIVQIDGGEAWLVRSPVYPLVFAGVRKGRPFHLLLREGDLVHGARSAKDYAPFPYRVTDGRALVVAKSDAGTILAGKLITLDLGKGAGWEWLRGATPEEVSSLRLICLSKGWTSECTDLLRKVADGNPYVDLLVAGDETTLDHALSVFTPQRLWADGLCPTTDVRGFIGSQPRLHTLALKCDKPGDLGFLARQRLLQTLILTNWKPAESGPLPDGLPSLRSLLVFGGEFKDLAAIGKQPRLQELTLAHVKSLEDLGRLAEFPALETLSLQDSGGVTDLEPLGRLKDLKWLALPPGTTQRQLNEVVRNHPNLLILAAIGVEHIESLTPVRRLGRLTAFMVATPAPLDPLYRMTNLNLLAVYVDKDDKKSAAVLGGLQQALPDTAVVRVAPICLGSGWILLLVPAVALAWWLAARWRRPKPDVRHA